MDDSDKDTHKQSRAIGQLIRSFRNERGTTLREFAASVGVSPATLSAMETGKTGISTERINQIATALQIHAGQLTEQRNGDPLPGSDTELSLPSGMSQEGTTLDWRDFSPMNINNILIAAAAAFVDTGYHGASMRSIATLAQLSVPGLYHHFRSKQDILMALLSMTMDDLLWRVKAARDEGSEPVYRVALVVEALALFHMLRSDMAFIGASEMRSLEPENRIKIKELRDEVQGVLDLEIDSAIRNHGPQTITTHTARRAIATMCTSLPQWFKPGGTTTAQQVAVEYADFALRILVLSRPT